LLTCALTVLPWQEVENHVGEELCRLFSEDPDIEWSSILRRSKEAARRLTSAGLNSRPRGPMAPLQLQQQPAHHHHKHQQGHGRRGFRGVAGERHQRHPRSSFAVMGAGGRDSDPRDMGRYTSPQTLCPRLSLHQCGPAVASVSVYLSWNVVQALWWPEEEKVKNGSEMSRRREATCRNEKCAEEGASRSFLDFKEKG